MYLVNTVTYEQNGVRKIYAFTCDDNGGLYINWWNGSSWNWANQGKPFGKNAISDSENRSIPDFTGECGNVAPAIGERPLLVILLGPNDPSDKRTRHTPEYFRELLFGSGNSLRNYFLENSYGKFTFKEAFITPWLTARDDNSTNDWDESSSGFIYSPDENLLPRKSSYVVQQVEKMTSFRFKNYDINNDGRVTFDELSIFWVYPGGGDARGRGFNPSPVPVPSLSRGVDVRLLIRGGAESSPTTIAHELGHQACNLGDLYVQGKGVGPFSLMDADYGNLYVNLWQHLDPWSKIKLGWIKPKVITKDGIYTLMAVEKFPEAYILYNPSRGNREYFIVENRWPENSFEDKLPARGLAIWHINENRANFDSRKTIRLVSPIANSLTLWNGSNQSVGYDFTPTSSPANSNWLDGTPSGVSIKNIPQAGPSMRFYVELSWD
jgi:M6 family metalloprotease-like protein